MRSPYRRSRSTWLRFCALSVAGAAVWGFWGCSGESDSEAPKDCAGLLVDQPCFTCVEASCCTELAACLEDTAPGGCTDCLAGDEASCNSDRWHALFVCGEGSCHDQCVTLATKLPTCDAPAKPPSGGACLTIEGTTCNVFTSDGCDTAAGEVCDYEHGNVHCYAPPNDHEVCEACGDDLGYCGVGMSCYATIGLQETGVKITYACARLCCDDSDCGSGTCSDKLKLEGAHVGVCLGGKGSSTAGSGGAGGGATGSGGGGGSGGG